MLQLVSALDTGLQYSDTSIFTCADQSIGIKRCDTLYYVFDSHACGTSGYHCNDGVASQIEFTTVHDVCTYIRNLFHRNQDKPFQLVPIRLTVTSLVHWRKYSYINVDITSIDEDALLVYLSS